MCERELCPRESRRGLTEAVVQPGNNRMRRVFSLVETVQEVPRGSLAANLAWPGALL